jgi:hypothetical protein
VRQIARRLLLAPPAGLAQLRAAWDAALTAGPPAGPAPEIAP